MTSRLILFIGKKWLISSEGICISLVLGSRADYYIIMYMGVIGVAPVGMGSIGVNVLVIVIYVWLVNIGLDPHEVRSHEGYEGNRVATMYRLVLNEPLRVGRAIMVIGWKRGFISLISSCVRARPQYSACSVY